MNQNWEKTINKSSPFANWIKKYIFFCEGLLTVDPKKRLTINEVMGSSWLMPKNRDLPLGYVSLLTPGILSIRSYAKATELAVKQTIDAFHMAAREGFRLQVIIK